MSKKQPKKLQVKRETLRALSASELEQVQGGAVYKNNCTRDYSGCISGR